MAFVDQNFPGLAVDQKDGRDILDAVILIYLASMGQDIDPGHSILRHKGLPFLGFGILGDAVDFQTLVVKLGINLLQRGNGLHAGGAPGRPEIHDDIAVCGIVDDRTQADGGVVRIRILHVDVRLMDETHGFFGGFFPSFCPLGSEDPPFFQGRDRFL